jgi:hypothetical protein
MNFEVDHLLHYRRRRKSDVKRQELNDQMNARHRSSYFAEERRIRRFLHAGGTFWLVDLNTDIRIDLRIGKIASLNDVNHHLPFGHLIDIDIVSTDTKARLRASRTVRLTFSAAIRGSSVEVSSDVLRWSRRSCARDLRSSLTMLGDVSSRRIDVDVLRHRGRPR